MAMRLAPVRFVARFPGSAGLALVNFVFQRILRINSGVPWMVHYTSIVHGDIRIGRDVWRSFALSGGCYVQGINGIYIGDGTAFGPGVKIISANHDPLTGRMTLDPPIRIGRRCWIGANAVILPGVVLGDGVIVAAGAVVTKSFDSGVTVAGVPARVIALASEHKDHGTGSRS